MKIKFDSDDNLPLKKTLEIYYMILGLLFMKATNIHNISQTNVCINYKC